MRSHIDAQSNGILLRDVVVVLNQTVYCFVTWSWYSTKVRVYAPCRNLDDHLWLV